MQTSRGGPALDPGRHAGFVVGCDWSHGGALHFDVTLMRGPRKGEVVSFDVAAGDGLERALAVFGCDAADVSPVVDIIGQFCELVVSDGDAGERTVGFVT